MNNLLKAKIELWDVMSSANDALIVEELMTSNGAEFCKGLMIGYLMAASSMVERAKFLMELMKEAGL